MVSGWPIRKKLTIGIALLLVSLAILAVGGILGSHSYRSLIRGINRRVPEIPLANSLAQNTSALLATVKPLELRFPVNPDGDIGNEELIPVDWLLWEEFKPRLESVEVELSEYQQLLESNSAIPHRVGRVDEELETAVRMHQTMQRIKVVTQDGFWFQTPELQRKTIEEVEEINRLAGKLPSFLAQRMSSFSDDVKVQYRTWIVSTWITSCTALILLVLIIRLFYAWVFAPLQQLIQGSRRVAGGDFNFRICVKSKDEIAELGNAMNDMTQRFQEIRDDLDGQVKQRTKEILRSEQLASVGFLAAGVAHEINNPLASIAWSAESLEERINEIVGSLENEDHDLESIVERYEVQVIRDYLKMIQDEAFRCKEITERLLDFSRLGDVEKQTVNLTELVQNVIDMVRHVGKYREKQILFDEAEPIHVPMNPQEIKQVVLNLITNGLDSLDPGGSVTVNIRVGATNADLVVSDNGCGMTDEVKEHLFEPFFTRRRDGQGTGLGMSISYRIINDHGGDLTVHSDGPQHGSTFTVKLPLKSKDATQEHKNRNHAA